MKWMAVIVLCTLCITGICQKRADAFEACRLSADSVQDPYLFYKTNEWLGVRYRYAGHSKKGIDCSGFAKMLYHEVYCTELSGGSKDLWKRVKPVKKDSLQEGDLVFFRIRRGQISHVGVYLGHGRMAHASVRWGVIISDLDEPYYKKYYFSGGRIAP